VETASTVINDALQELLVQASEQPIESVDFETAKRYLNRMMFEFDADGINLGFTQVVKASDPITVAYGAINGIIYNLAMNLATTFDVPVGPELALKAAEGKRIMTKIATTIGPSSYPDTLPIGSGNEGYSTDSYHFYEEDPATVDTQRGGVVGLERLPE
jgi:hypothetical protein